MAVLRERSVTVVAISHDVASTCRMADHIVILLPEGAVEGAPCDLRMAADPRIASFLSLDIDYLRNECGHQTELEDHPHRATRTAPSGEVVTG